MENNHVQENQFYPQKTPFYKKWWFWVIIAVVVIGIGGAAIGSDSNVDDQGNDSPSSDSGNNSQSQGSGNSPSNTSQSNQNNLGDYKIVVKSCRLAKDYEKKPIIIVKYEFTNNSDEYSAFWTTFEDKAFQNGIGLNECYVVADSANYSSDNKSKEIKPGATLEVEVAYVLNDSTTPVDIEVSELFSFDDKVVKKTFNIN